VAKDYRDVNSKTKKSHHPLPNIPALLDKTQGSRVFSVLDAKKGYFQCNIDPKSRDKTGFVTPFGIYKYLKEKNQRIYTNYSHGLV
jgi:hypothetical protein